MRNFFMTFKDLLVPSKKAAAGGLLFAVFFLLYGFTQDRIYAFDSLLYALAIRRPLSGMMITTILSPNHFLWLPFLRCFFIGLKSAGFTGDSYAAIQWLNTGMGALLITAVYGFLAKFIHRNWALLIACLAGFSHVIWLRATGGDPYLTGTLLSVAVCYLLTARSAEPGMPLLAGIALMGGMAISLHIANLVLLPIIALVIAGRRSRQNWLNVVFFLFLSGVILLPYVLFYDLTKLAGLKEWLTWGSGQVNGQVPGESASGQFDLHFLKTIPIGFSTLAQSLAALPANDLVLRLLAMTLAGSVCARGMINRAQRRLDRAVVLPPLVFFIGITVFFCVWLPGNLFYWASPLVFFVLSSSLIFSPQLQSPPNLLMRAAAGFFILSLGFLNFHRVIQPNREGAEAKPLLELCETLKRTTPSSSAILISGHSSGFLKVAIPYFAQRQMLSLDLLIIQYYGTGQDPLLVFQTRVNAYLKKGVPVYMLGDILLARGEFGAWGISADRIEAVLRSYKLTEVARLSLVDPGVLYRVEMSRGRS